MRKIILCLLAMSLILFACGETKHEVNTPAPSTSAPTGAVQGFVRDYKTNAAIEDVTVILYAAGARTTTTDAVGYWYFDNVRADDGGTGSLVYTLTAPDADEDGSADYLPMMGLTEIDETIGSSGDEYGQTNSLTLVRDWMVRTATVSGFVTDKTTGNGINEATVVILDYTGGPDGVEDAAGTWKPGGSTAVVDIQALSTTTAARTEGGDGYYSFTTVPALTFDVNDLGAYATGYEYNISEDLTIGLNLQFGSSAIVDFRLNPVDNKLGLVVASVKTATDTTTNMMILRDATGGVPGALDALVDMNGATQLVFNLIFDQAIDEPRFYGDTIQLTDKDGVVVLPNLAPLWTTGNYAVTLTGNIDIFDALLNNPYKLRTGADRIIYAAGDGMNIGAGVDLAQFNAYNSTFVATNPTPAVFKDLDDSYIVGHDNIFTYDTTSVTELTNATTAENYTGIYEQAVKNKYTLNDAGSLATGIDIYWTDAEPAYDVTSIIVYVRERDPASDEVLNNWEEVSTDTIFYADDRIIVPNLDIASATGAFYFYPGGTNTELRYGNALDIAVTLDDTLGVETAIDTTKILTLSDGQAPEIVAFADYGGGHGGTSYIDGMITFTEEMSASGMGISTSNSALFSMSPAWDQNVMTGLRINASGAASKSIISAGAGNHLVVVAGNNASITFASAGAADLFYVGQRVDITYANGDVDDNCEVTVIDTSGDNPTMTITDAAIGGRVTADFTSAATVTVAKTTLLRSGDTDTFADGGADDTGFGFIDENCGNVAVDDILILRKSTDDSATEKTVTVTNVANDGAGSVSVTFASTDTTGYDEVIFKGDILTVTATDEAGNAMHTDANEITPDVNDAWPGDPCIR